MFNKRKEKHLAYIEVGPLTRATVGTWFLCVKDVIMSGTNDVAYTKGKEYLSEIDGNLTDNKLSASHGAPNDFLREYFKVKSKYIKKEE
jgi:hypothetical protein